ncbi:MAG: head-tail connector protein [Pikeienuella sp.]
MLALVTIKQAKEKLRYLHSEDDKQVESMIFAASAAVVDYLDGQASTVLDLDSNGDLVDDFVVPAEVERATLAVIDALDGGTWEPPRPGALPYIAEMMLYRLTDPPLA